MNIPQNRMSETVHFSSRIFLATAFLMTISMLVLVVRSNADELRFRQIIDQPVVNTDGKEIAELDDLIIRRHGKVKKAVLSLGGFMDMGDKEVLVRFGALKIEDPAKIVYDTTRKQLENHTSFDALKQNLPQGYFYEPYLLKTPRGFYGRRHRPYPQDADRYPYAYGAPWAPYQYPPVRPGTGYYYPRAYHPWERAFFPRRMLGSFIIGRVVINQQGEEVATVEDLIIDQNHNVVRLILSVGGFFDIGDKLVAVPFKPLGFSDHGVTYDISAEKLEDLPAVRSEK